MNQQIPASPLKNQYSTKDIVRQARWQTQDARAMSSGAFVWTEWNIGDGMILIVEMDSACGITYGIEINGIIVAKTNSDYRAPLMVAAILQ